MKLYERDYYQWTYDQRQAFMERDFSRIDSENLIEELTGLGNSEESKLESHLANLILHLLKTKHQPNLRTRSWDLSIIEARFRVGRVLKKNPSLKSRLSEILIDAFYIAKVAAMKQTGFSDETFPEECPWSIEELLN